MTKSLRYAGIVFLLLLCVAGTLLFYHRHGKSKAQTEALDGASLSEFISLDPIDAHTHILQTGPAFLGMLQHLNMHVLDILYVDDTTPYLSSLAQERLEAQKFAESSGGRAQICTTFDPFRFNEKRFSADVVAGLNQDFQNGAVAVKIWKNIGMEIRKPSGQYLMPDNPVFAPIYRDIAEHDRTLISHQADRDLAWGNPQNPYYLRHPEWVVSRPGAPDKKTILQARDHVLAMNPNLRVVGAHFGCMEEHLDQLALRLDRYPNFAVDTAARIQLLVTQPREFVRAFILKYQDRILYGTDLNFYNGADDLATSRKWENQYALDWRYLSTDDHFEYQGRKVEGLDLPRPVLKKLYHDNALHWIPGLSRSPVALNSGEKSK